MRLHIFLAASFLLLSISSCQKYSFKKTASGLEYNIIKTEEGKSGSVGDIYDLNISVYTPSDSVAYTNNLKFQRTKPVYAGDFHEALSLLRVGDSAIIRISADSFFSNHGMPVPKGLQKEDQAIFALGVKKIMTPVEHFLYMNEIEYKDMLTFAARKNWGDMKKDTFGIMYQILEEKPEARKVRFGDTVKIRHLYYTLEERVIDKTKATDSWTFVVGDPQRISGLSNILSYMREGEKIRAIIPFAEAFGAEGLYPYIDPYATLVMEVDLLEIKNP
jgi:FKBP-type peptidyl-prolyl cis-trans isomerase FkpA